MLAIFGWTRAIIEPAGLYVAYSIVLLVWLASIIHPAMIAYRLDECPAKPFNRAWVYMVWIITMSLVVNQIAAHRGVIFGYDIFRITSSSMVPTVAKGDLIAADTWYFNDAAPVFGDLIFFEVPGNPNVSYVKRVVGLPGDTIEIRNNVLVRNGREIIEEYVLLTGSRRPHMSKFDSVVVPKNGYFVLGDNRHNSRDSRFIGSIPGDSIHGRVEYRWFAYDEGIQWSRFPQKLTASED